MSTIGNLVVNFLGNAKPLQATLASVTSAVGGFYSTLAGIIGTGVSIQAAREDSAAQKKLQAVLTATGYSAQLSAAQISDFASQLQLTTNFADETTVAAAAMLATFKSIKGDMFKEALVTAQDLATVLDMDLTAATTKLGKALQDPIGGLASLHKIGIAFTDQQKEMIKKLVESGDTLGAQKMILDSIKGSYAGAAQAMASPFKVMQNLIGEIGESIGRMLLIPMKFLANIVIPFLRDWGDALAKVGLAILVLVGIFKVWQTAQKAIAIGQALILSLSGPAGWAQLAVGAALFAGVLYGINDQFNEMQGQIDANREKFAGLAADAREADRKDRAFFRGLGDDPNGEKKRDQLNQDFGPKKSILQQIAEADKAFGGEGQAPWYVKEGIIEKASGIIAKTADLKAEIDRLSGAATETDQAIAKMWAIEGLSNQEKERYETLLRQRDALLEQKKIMDGMKDEAKQMIAATRTPYEKMLDEIKKINKLFDAKKIDLVTRDRAADKARNDYIDSLPKSHEGFSGSQIAGSAEAYSTIFAAMASKRDTLQERIAAAAEHQIALTEDGNATLQEIADKDNVDFVAVGVV